MAADAHPIVIAQASTCGTCRARIGFARLDTGKSMPFDVDPDPAGNLAVRVDHTGRVRGRVLTRDRPVLEGAERAHVPHFATCGRERVHTPRQDGVVPLYAARARRARRERPRPRPVPDGGLW